MNLCMMPLVTHSCYSPGGESLPALSALPEKLMIRALSVLLMTIAVLAGQTVALAETSPDQKAVLITGASSGLGRVMAETMAAN